MSSDSASPKSRRAASDAAVAIAIARELPDLQQAGSFALISKRCRPRPAPGVVNVVIDMHLGTCLRIEYGEVSPERQIGLWLDVVFRAHPAPRRLYFDGDKTVHQGALIAWGAAHGVPAIIHPCCYGTVRVHQFMTSLDEVLTAGLNDSPSALGQRHEEWRLHYNAAQSAADGASTA